MTFVFYVRGKINQFKVIILIDSNHTKYMSLKRKRNNAWKTNYDKLDFPVLSFTHNWPTMRVSAFQSGLLITGLRNGVTSSIPYPQPAQSTAMGPETPAGPPLALFCLLPDQNSVLFYTTCSQLYHCAKHIVGTITLC